MLAFLLSGVMIVLTMFIMMWRTGIRKWLGYANVVDILFTVIMIVLFHGTFAGVVSASFAGVFMSAGLSLLKAILGYERLERTGLNIRWVYYPPNTKYLVQARGYFRRFIEWA